MMKKSQVKIGETYRVKVSGNIANVRITGESPYGGWDGVNVATKRKVRIKSAQRLRGLAHQRPKGSATSAAGAQKGSKTTKGATSAPERDTGERGATGGEPVQTGLTGKQAPDEPEAKKMSLLDAAAHLLSLGTGEPMRCKAIVEQAVDRGLWTPGAGKTPERTLYAAILREIQKKGDKARFRKAERGKFALAE